VSDTIIALWDYVVSEVISDFVPPQSLEEQWDIPGLEVSLNSEFNIKLPVGKWLEEDDDLQEDSMRERIIHEIKEEYKRKETQIGDDIRIFEKQIMLQILDNMWKEHLAAMDYLRQGIHLRAYAQKQPKQEYKREAFELFEELLHNVKFEVIRFLARVQFQPSEDIEAMERKRREAEAKTSLNFQKSNTSSLESPATAPEGGTQQSPFIRREKKVGRNEPCPCGSGKKYKACHGKLS